MVGLPPRFISTKLNRRLFAVASCTLAFSANVVATQSSSQIGLSSLVAKSTMISHTDPSQKVTVMLVLPLSDASGAADFSKRVSTPGDPLYGKFLTPDQFAKKYGASESDYNAMMQWARKNGLTVGESNRSRTILPVRGTVSQMEELLLDGLDCHINAERTPSVRLNKKAGSTWPIFFMERDCK
jgi:subtilase family serine protease